MKKFDTVIGKDIAVAIQHLLNDELVGMPAETVYGLAANGFSEKAVSHVYAIKQRPSSNPLTVHVDRIAEVKQVVRDMPDTAEALLARFSPGPLTVLLKKNSFLPNSVTAGRAEVAIQIPAHPLTLELLRRIDFPLVAPTASFSLSTPPTHPYHVVKNFDGKIPYVLDGGLCEAGIESTVVGFEPDGTPVIYRLGVITPEEIEAVAGRAKIHGANGNVASPGSLLSAYVPKTPLYLADRFYPLRNYDVQRTGVLCFNRYYSDVPLANQFVLSPRSNSEEAAKNLYPGLRYLDSLQLDVMIAELCPPTSFGSVVNDRLQRAAYPFQTSRFR